MFFNFVIFGAKIRRDQNGNLGGQIRAKNKITKPFDTWVVSYKEREGAGEGKGLVWSIKKSRNRALFFIINFCLCNLAARDWE